MSDLVASAVGTVLTLLLTLAAMGWLFRQTDRPPEMAEGVVVMRYAPAYGWLGAVCLALGSALTLGMVLGPEGAPLALALPVGFVLFLLPGAVLVLSTRLTRVVVDADGLVLHSWARLHPADVRWREVERVSFARFMGSLVLHTRDGRRVRLSAFLVGISGLAATLAENLEGTGAREAHDALLRYRAAYGG